ncbi:hypothetical protein EDB83DRAFT_2398072 [Lactarius deliciosus]|nr:hypothetical protein EDB83DRAFT_2398072 [Lactarius deliciosus]
MTQLDSAQVTPHRDAATNGYTRRAALWCAYVARGVGVKGHDTGGRSLEGELRCCSRNVR